MVTPTCPKCSSIISSDAINVAADVALCRECNVTHKLSALAHGSGIDPNLDLGRPPKGAWLRASGLGTVIGATHRSLGGAVATLAFAAFWNGVVSIFVALALASTLAHLGMARPAWFPAPVMNGGAIGAGMTIFLWVFLTPFILIGLAMIGAFLSCLAGRTEVRIRDFHAEKFSGIGALGSRRKFRADGVKDVRIEDKRWRDSDGDRRRSTEIIIEMAEGKPVKFGSSLSEERRQFVAAALRKVLVRP